MSRSRHKALLVLILWLIPQYGLAESPDDLLIVVNRDVKVDKISLAEARDLFLKKRTKWDNGVNVVPIDAPEATKVNNDFQSRVLEMSKNEVRRYWESTKIRQGHTAPPVFEKTLKAVFKIKGAVGYIYRAQYLDGVVKVVLTLPAQSADNKQGRARRRSRR